MAGKVSDEDMFRLEKRMKKSEAIIASMSEEERTTPDLLARQVRAILYVYDAADDRTHESIIAISE